MWRPIGSPRAEVGAPAPLAERPAERQVFSAGPRRRRIVTGVVVASALAALLWLALVASSMTPSRLDRALHPADHRLVITARSPVHGRRA
ncbi:MAG TPA: hypothetical protein VKD47_06800 [Miltoncostaeaceae bacterium]|nr:hypothetical protein [Miltoncostaeaceae bacterium]